MNLHASDNLAKNHVLAIEPRGRSSSDEKLGPVCVRSLVCHRQQTRPKQLFYILFHLLNSLLVKQFTRDVTVNWGREVILETSLLLGSHR